MIGIQKDEEEFIMSSRSANSHHTCVRLAPLIEVPEDEMQEESPKFDERDREILKTDIKQFLSQGLIQRF